ncbi:MAG: hypothetical protein ACTSU5_03105 [Promethearchaeota archaeon]
MEPPTAKRGRVDSRLVIFVGVFVLTAFFGSLGTTTGVSLGLDGGAPVAKYGATSPSSAASSYKLSVYPVDLSALIGIVPLGHLAAPSHIFPTDHVYFELNDPETSIPVRSPAGGVVTKVRRSGDTDFSMMIEFAPDLEGWFDHMTGLNASIFGDLTYDESGEAQPNTKVSAGDVLGTVGGPGMNGVCLDFGLYDLGVTLQGFVHPEFYGDQVHTVCPLDYYGDAQKSELEDHLQWSGSGAPSCGKIDYDQSGKLVGNWFLKSWDVDMNQDWTIAAQNQLAFVYYNKDTSKVMVSIGGQLFGNESGVYRVANDSTDPAEVSAGTGKVAYQLYTDPDTGPYGTVPANKTVLVQVLAGDEIKVEGFTGSHAASELEFTSGAIVYDRGTNPHAGGGSGEDSGLDLDWPFLFPAFLAGLVFHVARAARRRGRFQ